MKTREKPDIVVEVNRDSIELASEASEDICTSGSEVQSKDMNEQRNSSLTDTVLEETVSQCSSNDSKPIEIIAKRPTNLSLSMTTSTAVDKVESSAQVRRASDTVVHTKEPENDTQRQLQSSNPQDIKFPFKPSYSSSPKASQSPNKATKGHRKTPSDPFFLSPTAYEHTPPRTAPSYTPSSSLSLSPPLPIAAYCSLPHSRRTSEASSFLASSGRFSDPAEELGRENAHFSVSEAMIAAIERAKCERIERGRTTQVRPS